MRFMCNNHRRQILSEPQHAIRFWELWMHQGQKLYQQGEWIEASHFYGCSFEVSEWLIQNTQKSDHKNTQLNYAERMMLSGHSLAECFKQMSEKQLELDILIKVHNLLTHTDKQFFKAHWLMDSYIATSLTSIRQYMKQKTKSYEQPHWDNLFQPSAVLH